MVGRVYAVGGFNSSLRERTVDVYDGVRDQWSAVASMQERRSTLGAAVLADLLYAVGGFNGSIGIHTLLHLYNHHQWYIIFYLTNVTCSLFFPFIPLTLLQVCPQLKPTITKPTSGRT